jgi:uncharacterized lipoprotein YajG
MIRPIACVITFAAASLLAGCNDAPKAAAVPPPVASAPTVAAVPIPPLSATGAATSETAKDTAANTPMGTLTKEEASKSMPMAGQANNHSSPSLDAAKK